MDRERELWGIALWVEQQHGDDGMNFIADRIAQMKADGEDGGVALWLAILERYRQLRPPDIVMP